MQISAHDYHNKFNTAGNSAVSTATPAWGHAWSSQQNVSVSQVKNTGGTYEVKNPVEDEKPVKKLTKSKN